MTDNKEQPQTQETIDVKFCVGNETLKLGTLPYQEAFEYYSLLTGPQTPYPVCRELDVELRAPKIPGISATTLVVAAGPVRTCTLCNRDNDKPNNFYATDCIQALKKRTCPDPFMKLIAEKFLGDKTKER